MMYNFKRDYSMNSDLAQMNERSVIILENDDEQDIYISERSSVASSDDFDQTSTAIGKRLPTPVASTILSIPLKQSHTLRYPYPDLTENGAAVLTHHQHQPNEEQKKKKKKDPQKTPPNHSYLFPLRESKQFEYRKSDYPSWYSDKVKNSDWNVRHGQTTPYDTLDSSLSHRPVLTTSSIKPQQSPIRNSRHPHAPILPSTHNKQRLDHSENNSSTSTYLTIHENQEIKHSNRRVSPKTRISFKESDHDEHHTQPVKRTISQQRRKLKTENEWTENHVPSVAHRKLSQDSNSLTIISNSTVNGTRNRSKIPEKNSRITDADERGKYRPSLHYHHQTHSYNSPFNPDHPQNHLHVRRRPPSGTNLNSNLHIVDVSFKKPDRSLHTHQTRDPLHAPTPPVSNPMPHLPPIIRDHQQQKSHSPRFPTEYYGTLARQTREKNWEESQDIPRIYKPESQTRFYDRYIHSIVDKRLAA